MDYYETFTENKAFWEGGGDFAEPRVGEDVRNGPT